jgi:hypothetical protein
MFEDAVLQQTKVQFPFVVGRLHVPVNNVFRHPYFHNNDWQNGSLIFNNNEFLVSNLKYDTENDKLIYLLTSVSHMMYGVSLDQSFVTEFDILDKKFRYCKKMKDIKGQEIDSGYYEVVYDGVFKFLVRSAKERVFDNEWPYYNFKESVDMYLIKTDNAIKIKNKRDLVKHLNEKKTDVKRFIKDNGLVVRSSDYSSVSIILNYYEHD